MFRLFLLISLCAWGFHNQAIAQKKGKPKPFQYFSHFKTAKEINALENKMDKVFYMLCGQFRNGAQAANASEPELKIKQELMNFPIWKERREYWYCSLWYMEGQPHKPLSTDIIRLVKIDRDSILMQFYTLPEQADGNYGNEEWNQEKPFANLKPKDLVPAPAGSRNVIINKADGVFDVLSVTDPCYYPLSEQRQYMHYRLQLTANEIRDFTMYLDKDKKVVYEHKWPDGLLYQRLLKPTYYIKKK